ncbi:VOC family protein [Massilia sp. BSC265]|uniref:VOC family protein n=1 Tax=Massilia sp. BSC265 TaxID=1549812 RepID=UPI0004E89475|nr:VOC family protein [Massilia sp. BSC265]KFI06558.1 glyoxalase [Massilia sp. BSC265]
MKQAARPIPEGFHSVTPHLVCEGAADAIAFYSQAFGAVEVSRMSGPGGKIMHAELRIGDSIIMLCDDFPEYGSRGPLALQGSAVVIHLYVPDADSVWERALAAGARPLMPLGNAFWGDRYGQLADPFGHRWAIATRLRDMTPREIEAEMAKAMPGACGSA